MPKGVPKAGFRRRRGSNKRAASLSTGVQETTTFGYQPDTKETDDQIRARLKERFDILEMLGNAAITGDARALIVSGPAGLGKSFTIEKLLEENDPNQINYGIIKGFVKATGLYKQLWKYRMPGQVLVFDDADSIFFDDVSLNMLKAVCDTTERRVVSYLAEVDFADDEGEAIPRSFEFDGTIIFITNLDFDSLIARGHKLTPHLQAMVSRAHYIDLAMKTRRDYIIRIKQVLGHGMLRERGLSKSQESDVIGFIENHAESLRELSLRMAIKIGTIRKMDRPNWQNVAKVTCCRN